MGIAARRHAQAVFQIARGRNEVEGWRADLRMIAAAMADPQLQALLENPKVHLSEKIKLVNQCLPGVSQLALNLTYLLVARRRLGIAGDIFTEYEKLADAHQGIEHAEVVSAIPIDDGVKNKLAEHLASITGNKVLLSTEVDPKLIGGLVVQVGDRLIDGSIKTKLAVLKKSLLAPK